MSSLPPSLKPIQVFLQRAAEVKARDPVVAYYCRTHAVERGLEIRDKDDQAATAFIMKLMDDLEAEKAQLELNDDSPMHVEGFAMTLFDLADRADRDGRATMVTAKQFYASATFMDILNQFGELVPHVAEKQKYAMVKAADITKCLREGTKPKAGPLGGANDEDDEVDVDAAGSADAAPSAAPSMPDATQATAPSAPPAAAAAAPVTSAPSAPPAMAAAAHPSAAAVAPPASAPPAVAVPAVAPPRTHGGIDFGSCDPTLIDKAQRAAKHAISAMQHEDLNTAVANLRDALQALETVQAQLR